MIHVVYIVALELNWTIIVQSSLHSTMLLHSHIHRIHGSHSRWHVHRVSVLLQNRAMLGHSSLKSIHSVQCHIPDVKCRVFVLSVASTFTHFVFKELIFFLNCVNSLKISILGESYYRLLWLFSSEVNILVRFKWSMVGLSGCSSSFRRATLVWFHSRS